MKQVDPVTRKNLPNDVSDSDSSQSLKEIIKQINSFLEINNLFCPETLKKLKLLSQKFSHCNLSQLPFLEIKNIKTKIDTYTWFLKIIKLNNIPRNAVVQAPSQTYYASKPLSIPPGVSIINCVFSGSINDVSIKDIMKDMIFSRIPLLITLQTFFSVKHMLNKEFEQYYCTFINTYKDIILFLPKQNDIDPINYLTKLGYNSKMFNLESVESIKKTYNDLDDISETQMTRIAHHITELFIHNPDIKKRLNVSGHGLTKKIFAGFLIEDFIYIRNNLLKNGLQYENYFTCFAAGRNLVTIFGKTDSGCTTSICSLGDYPSFVCFKKNYFPPKFSLRLRNIRNFWELINKAYKQTTLSKDPFVKALNDVYTYSLTCLPMLSIAGNNYFETINLNNNVYVLSYKLLYKYLKTESEIKVSNPIFAVYPQVIDIPVIFSRNTRTKKLPAIIPKVAGNKKIFFNKMILKEGSHDELINDCFLFEPYEKKEVFDCAPWHRADNNLFVVKEIQTNCSIFCNHITFCGKYGSWSLYQKKGFPDKWFYQGPLNKIQTELGLYSKPEEWSTSDAAMTIYMLRNDSVLNTSEVAFELSAGDMPFAKQNNFLFFKKFDECFANMKNTMFWKATVAIKKGDISTFNDIIQKLSPKERGTLLFLALTIDNTYYLEMLLKNKCNMKVLNIRKRNIFLFAAKYASAKHIKLLSKKDEGSAILIIADIINALIKRNYTEGLIAWFEGKKYNSYAESSILNRAIKHKKFGAAKMLFDRHCAMLTQETLLEEKHIIFSDLISALYQANKHNEIEFVHYMRKHFIGDCLISNNKSFHYYDIAQDVIYRKESFFKNLSKIQKHNISADQWRAYLEQDYFNYTHNDNTLYGGPLYILLFEYATPNIAERILFLLTLCEKSLKKEQYQKLIDVVFNSSNPHKEEVLSIIKKTININN